MTKGGGGQDRKKRRGKGRKGKGGGRKARRKVFDRDERHEGEGAGVHRERPTPVRDAMQESQEPASPSDEVPSRRFHHGEEEWIVRLEGRTRSGRAADSGAPLLHLRFYREPEAADPERHVVAAGRSLDDFHDQELSDALERSRPWGPPEPFYQEPEEGRRKPRGR